MELLIVRGQFISLIVYSGEDYNKVQSIYDFVKGKQYSNLPLDLNGCDFQIAIHDIEILNLNALFKGGLTYVLTVKGFIV